MRSCTTDNCNKRIAVNVMWLSVHQGMALLPLLSITSAAPPLSHGLYAGQQPDLLHPSEPFTLSSNWL